MKNLKKSYILLMCLVFPFLRGNFLIAQSIESKSIIEVAIVDFLYVSEGFRTAKQLERDVLIPGIDRALHLMRTLDYRFNVKRVVKGNLSYFVHTQVKERVSEMPYDIAIWGHVTPYESLGSYDLQLMIFTNPKRLQQCLFYYEIEVRDGRIRRWNNKLCDLPESGLAIIPSVLCFKLISYLKMSESSQATPQNSLENDIRHKLLPLIEKFPTDEPINWHPEQDCDANQMFGSIRFELLNQEELTLPLSHSLYATLRENIKNGVDYNWPVDQDIILTSSKKRWLLTGAGAAVLGGIISVISLGGAGEPPEKDLPLPPAFAPIGTKE